MNRQNLELIQKANRYGLEGKKVIGWIPPVYASDNPDGTFILGYEEKVKGASSK